MSAYYNENDPKAAAWLRELIAADLIAPGDVDERSITDVSPDDLKHYRQCHFFAGIGGWSLALRGAGVSDDARVWTGSCPCQPFSGAGKGGGTDDERHLWPDWHHLVRICRPPIVFGEQVASKPGLAWLDIVSSDLEGEGYAVGAADICAASIGAPHIRQRLFFVARMADVSRQRWGQTGRDPDCNNEEDTRWSGNRIGDGSAHDIACGMADGNGEQRDGGRGVGARGWNEPSIYDGADRSSAHHGGWGNPDWLWCRDDRWRPVEPGTFPLAHGVSDRVGILRGYGNAIVPQVATAFIRAALDT